MYMSVRISRRRKIHLNIYIRKRKTNSLESKGLPATGLSGVGFATAEC